MICNPLVMDFDSFFHLLITLQLGDALGGVVSCSLQTGLGGSMICEDSVFSTGFEDLVVWEKLFSPSVWL